MTKAFQIISDSSCDFPLTFAAELDVKIVPYYVSFDKETYHKEVQELPVRDLYQKMVDNPQLFPKTSLPSIEDYISTMEPFVKDKMPIICICLSSKFSGSYNAACNAKSILLEQYPDGKITVIDSTLATVLQGLLVQEAVRMERNQVSYEDTAAHLERIKSTGRIIFTTADISYLKTGGRLGKLMSIANNALKIKPMILLKEGELFPFGIARSRRKSLDKILLQVRKMIQELDGCLDDYIIATGYGYDREEGEQFRDMLLEDMKTYCDIDKLDLYQIGATIGTHTGPHPIGFGFIRRYDC